MLTTINDNDAVLDDAELAPLRRFVERECRLLDERRFTEWLDLYAPSATYWAPARHGQASPDNHVSLFWDDKESMTTRVQRLLHPEIHSQIPPSTTVRLVSNFRAVTRGAAAGQDYQVECRFLMVEDRPGSARQSFAGVLHHLLNVQDDATRILHKKVEITDCGHAFHTLTQPF
jgi:benzoate/toluate 1,2-dioxygenase beta subunit